MRLNPKKWLSFPAYVLRRPALVGVYGRLAVEHYRRHGLRSLVAKTADFLGRRSGAGNYAEWLKLVAERRPGRAGRLAESLARVKEPIRISVVMPVHKVDPRWLSRAIASVRTQSYPHWELCVCDDGSLTRAIDEVLAEAATDPRVKIVRRAGRGGIARATNEALALADGEYVGFLDHDDELDPDALLEMAAAVAEDPSLDLLYSDEDKIDETGKRFSPHFKPAFDRELLHGQNYVCHFLVVKTDLVRELGGLRQGFDGAQDYDLILRVIEKTDRIAHVPRVLYHWRTIRGSTSLGGGQKPHFYWASRKALQEHLDRTGSGGRGGEGWFPCHRVIYAVPSPSPLVTIIVPTRDRADLLRTVVDGLFHKTSYANFELIIVDNGSREDATRALFDDLKRYPNARVLRFDEPFNFSRLNNVAVREARGELILFLNNDIEVTEPDWLDEMVGRLSRKEIGAVGAKLLYPNRSLQHGGITLGLGGGAVAGHTFLGFDGRHEGYFRRLWCAHEVSAVTAACLLTRKSLFESVGGFDEKNLAIAYNDTDYCLKIREKGLKVIWTPWAELVHHESVSRGPDISDPAKKSRFQREQNWMRERWRDRLTTDPYYNPNLSLTGAFELAFPPRL